MTQDQILTALSGWLTEFVAEWDLNEPIGAATLFNGDLCFSSIDLLHFLAIIDMKMGRKLPFGKLMLQSGSYRAELTVQELADFVYANQNVVPQQPQAM